MNILEEINKVFEYELDAIRVTQNSINEEFYTFVDEIDNCQGHVIFTGMGKSGHICRKIVATMQSLGIKSYFLHPGEALHGDLGMLLKEDIIIALSNSGETEEILSILPTIKKIGSKFFCILGRANSTLQKYSTHTIIIPPIKEAYLNQLVPTSSTTVSLVIGDALAVTVAKKRGFSSNDFGVFHPHGLLGKRLTLTVEELMLKDNELSVVKTGSTIRNAIFEMCRTSVGGVCIVDNNNNLLGVFTDGDLRRLCKTSINNIMEENIDNVMTKDPLTFTCDILISDLINTYQTVNKLVSFFPIVNNNKLVGELRLLDITNSGLLS